MSGRPFTAVLVGLGRIGVSYSSDPLTQSHFQFITHADVLSRHPDFTLIGAADLLEENCKRFAGRFHDIEMITSDPCELSRLSPDVAVFATPPEGRLALIEQISPKRAIILEKPVTAISRDAPVLRQSVEDSGLVAQVNFWRRADRTLRRFSNGELTRLAGRPRTATCIYGGGLRNNGIHMVDLVRMLMGEVSDVCVFERLPSAVETRDPSFVLRLASGVSCVFVGMEFGPYREISLEIWGTKGRVSFLQEGLRIGFSAVGGHRALTGEVEVSSDDPRWIESGAATAIYDLYTNVSDHLENCETLWSPLSSALKTEAVIEAVERSVSSGSTEMVDDV